MRDRPLVEIFCDGSTEMGYGHIRRCISLASQLEKDDVEVRIVGLSAEAQRLLPVPSQNGRIACIQIFDSPYNIEQLINAAHSRGQISVALDWFGEFKPDINISVYPHREVLGRKKTYIGFDYILLSEEILLHRQIVSSTKANKVLVVLGGGDLLNQGHEISRLLFQKGLDVTLVQGPFATNSETANGYEVLSNPPDLPQLLATCDWAVTNGGGCLFEAMCIGKAAFVFPQTEAEAKIARYVQKQGGLLGIGYKSLRAFLDSELCAVAERGAKLVDGLGTSRVSSIVRGLM